MNKIELAVAEETTVETHEEHEFELSLSELDFVGGGQSAVAIA
jgi:hypothetical protein